MIMVKESKVNRWTLLLGKLPILLLFVFVLTLSGCLGKYPVLEAALGHLPQVCFSLKKNTDYPTISLRGSCPNSDSTLLTF